MRHWDRPPVFRADAADCVTQLVSQSERYRIARCSIDPGVYARVFYAQSGALAQACRQAKGNLEHPAQGYPAGSPVTDR